jgi:hypothetical protein
LFCLLLHCKAVAGSPATSEKPAKTSTAAVHEPAAGTAERKAILDALRKVLETQRDEFAKEAPELKGRKIVITVDWLKTNGTWAYVSASFEPDFMEGVISATLKRSGETWKVEGWRAADDVEDYDHTAKSTDAPRNIFPPNIPAEK